MRKIGIYKIFPVGFILVIAVLCMAAIPDKSSSAADEKGKVQVLTLADMPKLIYNYKKNPEKWVYEGNKPAIIDFYADWCGPCKKISPILARLAKKYQDKIIVYKVDVDVQKEMAAMFGVKKLPTLVYIPMERKPFQRVGLMPNAEINLEKLITDSLLVVKK